MLYNRYTANLIEQLGKLPGIGPKSAQRLAFHLINRPRDEAEGLARAIMEAKENIRFCVLCFNLSEAELCEFCSDPGRDRSSMCVVEEPKDIVAVERTARFKGLYHVLGGVLAPMDGVGPKELRLEELMERIRSNGVQELILATNPTAEGEATALFIADMVAGSGVRATRIASGLPVGGDLEYADEVTLARALDGRRDMARPLQG